MAYSTYKLIDATQLEADLKSISTALNTKLGASANTTYTFPQGYCTAINSLSYDATPNTASDISFNGDNVVVNAGIFNSQATKALPTDYVGTGITRIHASDLPLAIQEGDTELVIPAGYYESPITIDVLL